MIDGLSLIGAGSDSCIVDSHGFPLTNNRTITMKNSCLIKGFYIRTSNDFNYGQGIRAEGQTGLITENKFSNANSGISLWQSNITVYKNYCFNIRRGIGVFNSNSIVRKNEIFTLTESSGAGIFIDAFSSDYYPVIDSNYIETIYEGIRKSFGANPLIKNNVIKLKYASAGIFLSTSDSTKIFNNLVMVDSIAAVEGIRNYGVQYLQLHNNLIVGNFLLYGMLIDSYDNVKNNLIMNAMKGVEADGTQNLLFQYNNLWNNSTNTTGFTPDTTNLSVDPMIVNDDTTQGELDFRLQMYSPLIDAGDPAILDRDGSRSDIGLYGGPYGWTHTLTTI